MSKFNLKSIIAGQAQAKVNNFNTDLFKGDRENLEEFDKLAYSEFHLVSVDHKHDKGEHDKLVESVIAIGHESDFYLITATTTSFNGEIQVNYSEQPITLKGLNYFSKDAELDIEEVYNNYLSSEGYEITVEDIKEIGELNTEYNVTTLRFKDDGENMHYLTVNSKNQLSGITVKLSGREARPAQPTISSAFN